MTREQQIKLEIKRVFQQLVDDLAGYRVVLYGSRVTGTARPHSDFDVGVIGPRRLPSSLFYRIKEMLDGIDTLYEIDWVDFSDTSKAFREEALRTVEVLYG
jgi:predicted nucleotidyltransferase